MFKTKYCQKNGLNKNKYLLRKLRKQILSNSESTFQIPEKFLADEEVYKAVGQFIDNIKSKNVIEILKDIGSNCENYDLRRIYIAESAYEDVSIFMGYGWNGIRGCLEKKYEKEIAPGKTKEIKIKKLISQEKERSIAEIDELFHVYGEERDGKSAIKRNDDWKCFDFKFSDTEQYNDISEFYKEVELQGYYCNGGSELWI